MWRIILDQLNRKDEVNALNCSLYLRKILHNHRTSVLFPNILNTLIAVKFEFMDAGCETTMLLPSITKKDIFNARLICSPWNAAVKDCYDKTVMSGIHPFVEQQEGNLKLEILDQDTWSNPYIFSTTHPGYARKFVATFIERHDSMLSCHPFLGRFLIIKIGFRNVDNYDMFLDSLIKFLQTFGHQVWYVVLQIAEFVDWREWIFYMPNLVSLRIKFETGWLEQPMPHRRNLPDLIKLRNLDVFGLRSYVLGELFTKYNHIPYINIENCELVVEWSPNPFINLKKLSLKIADESEYDILEWVGKNMKLETLAVYNHVKYAEYFRKQAEFVENDGLMLSLFLKIREYWSNSLYALSLVFEGAQLKRKYSLECLQLQLPQLCKLELISDGNIFLDFIQPLKELQILVIKFVTNDMYTDDQNLTPPFRKFEQNWIPDQIIQFIGFESRMQESNIWTLLRGLKKLTVVIARRNPILYYDYTRQKSGSVVRKTYAENISPSSTETNIFPYFKH